MSDHTVMTVAEVQAAFPKVFKRSLPPRLLDPVFVYREAHKVEGDFSLDRMNAPGEAGSYLFLNDLEITGNLLNWNLNYGIELVVEGHLTAQNIVAGGAFIHLHTADIPGVVLGHYNDGYIGANDYAGPLQISDDHHMNLRRTGPNVSLYDAPNSGRDIFVDDIKLPYDTKWETVAEAFLSFFGETPWIDDWDVEPKYREEALREGEYSILWADFVHQAIEKGAPTRDDSFLRLADHMRRAFQAAASDTDTDTY